MQTKNLISQPGAMNTYEKVCPEGGEEEGEMSKEAEPLGQRLTESYDGFTAKYRLASHNDCIISPYKTYDLFYEITFRVLPKLGMYEDIGTVEECREAMKFWKAAKELAGRGL